MLCRRPSKYTGYLPSYPVLHPVFAGPGKASRLCLCWLLQMMWFQILENCSGVTKTPGQLAWDGIRGHVVLVLDRDRGDVDIPVFLYSDWNNKEHTSGQFMAEFKLKFQELRQEPLVLGMQKKPIEVVQASGCHWGMSSMRCLSFFHQSLIGPVPMRGITFIGHLFLRYTLHSTVVTIGYLSSWCFSMVSD